MIGSRIVRGRGTKDEGEKPFWISFSDLMTALMVLFLVVMVISLLSVTQELRNIQEEEKERSRAIDRIMSGLSEAAIPYKDIVVSRDRLTIDFGQKALFARGKFGFSPEGADILRSFVPEILKAADGQDGQKWFKQVVIEGFTDTDGSYLYNLDLSLHRAESVVCALMEQTPAQGHAMSEEGKRKVRELFLVGGFSFNSAKETMEESRRVELRLDFRAVNEAMPPRPPVVGEFGRCQL